MLWNRSEALSQSDENFGTVQLPEFKIVLSDETSIYLKPHNFAPSVGRENEEE